ncbi:MAG: diguanylate cyclase [Methylococcales bacterium]|nr:diguanylate cyclase [Methylococcales bacterium]
MSNELNLVSEKQHALSKKNLNKHIFLVESDHVLAHRLAEQIQVFGFQNTVLLSAETLLVKLKEQQPCAIIIDYDLSDQPLSGIEAIKKIRAQGEDVLPLSVPIIFISKRTDIQSRLEAIKVGGNAYLPKPLEVSHLIEWIDKLVNIQEEEACQVLIVHNNHKDAHYHARILEAAGILTTICDNPLQILNCMEHKKPDLILMDLYMPGFLGSDIASMIRQIDPYVAIPIIYLSPQLSNQVKTQALLKGGDNFLFKPVLAEILVSMVTYKAQRFRKLRALMLKDGLTGLYNHRHIKEFIKNECARAQRNGTEVSIALFDVDFFKKVNDRYGHVIGDVVLKTLAHFLQDRVRTTDLVGRYGGEEFLIVFPNTSSDIAEILCENLRENFEKILHFSPQENFHLTFSCGIASYPQYNSAQVVADSAGQALYISKNKGRNQVTVI